MLDRRADSKPENDERVPWWSRPVTIAIRVVSIAVLALFVVLTVVRLLNS